MNKRIVGIATRVSKLALYQADLVKVELEKHFPGIKFEIRVVKTLGDKILDVPLSKIGDKGLFTKELEYKLMEGEADLAVHSLKDMPTDLPEGLIIGGVLKRGDVRDALVSISGKKMTELDENDIVATSSLRRIAQIRNLNKRIRIVEIRGNVDTRMKKMREGTCTAMVMAAAGLQRLGFSADISEFLDPHTILPAAGQGAIAIETRKDDEFTSSILKKISDADTSLAVSAERTLLKDLDGGCQVPFGCYSELSGERFRITGFVSNPDGTGFMKGTEDDLRTNADEAAHRLAKKFISMGAGEMIKKIRSLSDL